VHSCRRDCAHISGKSCDAECPGAAPCLAVAGFPAGQPELGSYRSRKPTIRRSSVTGRDPGRITLREGKTEQYLAALAPLLEQARKEPGTLLYAVHRSAADPQVFWTTEIYADENAFAAQTISADDT